MIVIMMMGMVMMMMMVMALINVMMIVMLIMILNPLDIWPSPQLIKFYFFQAVNEQEQEEGEEEGQVFDVIITKIKPPGDDDADQQKGTTYGLLLV